jgi:hypothetical protein
MATPPQGIKTVIPDLKEVPLDRLAKSGNISHAYSIYPLPGTAQEKRRAA